MGFALYYILYSFVFLLLVVLVFALISIASAPYAMSLAPQAPGPEQAGIPLPLIPLVILGVVCMLPYFPLGMLKAKRGCWTVPTRRAAYLAILQPCGISVLWVLLSRLSAEIFQLFFLVLILFAGPSTYFSFFCSAVLRTLGVGWLSLIFAPLLSAILPPLLFGLGSFWQSRRQSPLSANSPAP